MADIDIFALTPAVALQGVIDYKSVEGRKLYKTATSKLDEKYMMANQMPCINSFIHS